jgi:molecular chaperone DnaK (HSP70)
MSSEKLRTKPPYSNTKVPFEKTKAKLEKLLKSYGVRKIVWASDDNEEVLMFEVLAHVKGIERGITIQIKPPHIVLDKRQYGRMVHTENKNQEWRLVFHWVKSKIEAVMWGLSTIEREFLSEVSLKLPDGSVTTIGERIQEIYETIQNPALEDHHSNNHGRVIEAEVVRESA